jgi:deoxycytidine triphosphate deaminase
MPEPGILADHQIKKAIQRGWLEITPFEEQALQPASYDFAVGDIAILSTETKPTDLRQQRLLTIEAYASALLQTDEILRLSNYILHSASSSDDSPEF